MQTNEKIAALRNLMAKNDLDAYLVTTADPHQSEYIAAHFKERAWLTGFTGSAGTALVTRDKALLWADGRYFIQAAKQIEGSEFQLMKMGTKGCPMPLEYIKEHLPEGSRVGVSDLAISQDFYERGAKSFEKRHIRILADTSLISEIWKDVPPLPSDPVFHHELTYTGKTSAQKIEAVREKMRKEDVDAYLMASLDDIAWLFNFRGSDVSGNPVALAFALITPKEAKLFIDKAKVPAELMDVFRENQVTVCPYGEIAEALHHLKATKIALDKTKINRRLYRSIPEGVEIANQTDYVYLMKAVLNDVELQNQREAAVRDSAVVTRYLFHLKRNPEKYNEWDAALYLHELRKPLKNFLHESFETISAYGPNAAMMHYAPTEKEHAQLQSRSFYLVDCGSQFLDGTTDITRTIALGELTEEEIRDYTLTLKGHIQLARAIFMEQTPGYYLEVLAREPLWRAHMDYKCGTGHGFGYVLGVHEGPQSISKRYQSPNLEVGMVITNEPGVYKEGKHGIRLENDYVVAEEGEGLGDRYFCFEALTYVPFDREAIDVRLLDEGELEWLNRYHAACVEKLMPLMETEEEREDLKAACAEIKA